MKLNRNVVLGAALALAAELASSVAVAAPVYGVDLSASSGTRNKQGPAYRDSRASADGVSFGGGSDVEEFIAGFRPVHSIGNATVTGKAGPGLMSLFAWAGASTDAVRQPSTGFSSGAASAFLHDAFTIFSPTAANGSRGTMTFAVSLDGALGGGGRRVSDGPGGGYSFSSVWSTNFGLTSGFGNAAGNAGGSYRGNQDDFSSTETGLGTGLHKFTLDFAFGRPIDLQWQSNLSTSSRASSSGNEPHFMAEAESIANFASTFAWAGILSVLDQNGVPINVFTALNERGVDYAHSFVSLSVPEPSPLLLLLLGLAALAFAALSDARITGPRSQRRQGNSFASHELRAG